jgi:16S rRNA (guanine527-N7)-methyltransferase
MTAPPPLDPTPDFLSAAAALGIQFEPGDLDRLGRFLALMLETNKTTNLTAITDPAEAWRKHILDALTLVPVIESLRPEVTESRSVEVTKSEPEAATPDPDSPPSTSSRRHSVTPSLLSLVDLGSGGGVPAIPLAIVMPDVRVTLVEATGKKVAFLRSAIESLGLTNAHVLQARAETIGHDHKAHREKYDLATARALGHLAVVAELAGPLVRPHGHVVAVKGARADQELAEAGKALGLIGLRHAQTVDTPTGRLVLLEKTIRTPRTYPRRDGEPARVPLGLPR